MVAPNPDRLTNPTPNAMPVLQRQMTAAVWRPNGVYNSDTIAIFTARFPRLGAHCRLIPYPLRKTTGIFIVQSTKDSTPHNVVIHRELNSGPSASKADMLTTELLRPYNKFRFIYLHYHNTYDIPNILLTTIHENNGLPNSIALWVWTYIQYLSNVNYRAVLWNGFTIR